MSISVKESVITPKKSVVCPTDSSAATQPLTHYTRYKVYTQRQLQQIEALQALSPEQRFEMEVVANVLPFRVNEYVINELIDWDNIPADPIFQLTFPQRGMIEPADLIVWPIWFVVMHSVRKSPNL